MGFFGSLISTVSKIATSAYTIFKTAKPILEALRPAIDEVDDAFVFIEEKITEGGVVADDFLDRNLETILTLEHVSGKGVVVFGQINEIAAKLRVYSQEQTPDTIDKDETEDLGREFLELRALIASWKPQVDAALKAMDNLD